MAADVLDGAALRRMIEAGAARLRQGEARVNALNVFPVPDGDTGRNMNLTMQAVLEELERVPPSASLSDVARAAAAGSLRGARGNSGVILSQFFRGFELAFRGLDRTSPVGLAAAFRRAADTAYQMVMRPVEGTILTVMRAAAEQADRAARAGAGLQALLEQSLQAARDALARTPEMLEVLKKAGVVDAGGQGLVLVLEGFLEAQRSTGGAAAAAPEAGSSAPGAAGTPRAAAASGAPATQVAFELTGDLADIRFPYDVELFILAPGVPVEALREGLGRLGDSVIVVPGDGETKVHVHTDAPAAVLDLCLGYGPVHEVQILNMRAQYAALQPGAPGGRAEALEASPGVGSGPHGGAADEAVAQRGAGTGAGGAAGAEPARLAVVAVVPGQGLADIFRSLGCGAVVAGGQTMNPSAEEVASAADGTGAAEVIVLPNNSNVVLACRQAAQLTSVRLHIVPTRTVPQGIAAVLAFQPDKPAADNVRRMEEAMAAVRSGSVTYAVRDGSFDGVPFRQGDVLGLAEDEIVAAGQDRAQVLVDVVGALLYQEAEIVTLYYGADVDEERAAADAARLEAAFPGVDVEVHPGGQAHYFYIVSVE